MRGALLIAVLAALAGCGAGSTIASSPGTTPATTAAATTGSATSTELKITFWPNGSDTGVAKRATLRCDPAGGTLARSADACRRLAALKNPFAPPRSDLMCTQQYGGPAQAQITGTYRGRRVSVRLGLGDGCQIARFAMLGFLLPGYRAVGVGPGG